MALQRFELFPHMTALENVMEGPVMVKRMNHRAAAHLARGLLAKVPKSTSAARNRATRESSNTIDLAE